MPKNNLAQQFLIVIVMMILAFYFQEIAGSQVIQKALPAWPFVLTLYFSVSSRFFFSVFSAFIVGLIQDTLMSIPTLGLHAGIYVLAAFVIIVSRMQFKYLSLMSQTLVVGALVFVKILAVMLYESFFYSPPSHLWDFLSIPFSMLFWIVLRYFFLIFSKKYR
ncbi:MAG: rod shape-determining protein MreD [Gammaproteobacteria bacterium]|nr:MAG: rod shape-determining protein MreD [Gammaproteobacteria bacterium]